jgi:hypothetical protein
MGYWIELSFIHCCLTFIFNLNFIFKTNFLALDGSQAMDFLQRSLLRRGGNKPQDLFSRALFPLEDALAEFYFPSEDEGSRESCSDGVLQIHRAPRGLM